MPHGSEIPTNASEDRRNELEKRKETVIAILNKTYAEDEQDIGIDFEGFQNDEVLFHDVASGFQNDEKDIRIDTE
jgi:hypothetical protein